MTNEKTTDSAASVFSLFHQNIRPPQQASSTAGKVGAGDTATPNTSVKSDRPPAALFSVCAFSNFITPFQFRGAACRLPQR